MDHATLDNNPPQTPPTPPPLPPNAQSCHYLKRQTLNRLFPPAITTLHQETHHHRHLRRRETADSMRPGASYYYGAEYHHQQPHFLDSCSLCHKPLGHNIDIYMYRGNTPFCSQECRQEQIEIDEAKEKRWKISSSSSSSKRSNSVRQNKDSTKESDTNKAVRTGTVAVA